MEESLQGYIQTICNYTRHWIALVRNVNKAMKEKIIYVIQIFLSIDFKNHMPKP